MAKTFAQQSRLGRLRAALRQWMYPAEFRIPETVWSEKIAAQLGEALTAARTTDGGGRQDLADKHLVAIGTRLWRLRSEIMRNDAEQSPAALRHASRHLEVLWDRFSEAGLDIFDHTGEAMPEVGDYLLKVIEYQPTNRVECNRVLETVKPTIRFNKKIIQVGEVIVGTPEKSG